MTWRPLAHRLRDWLDGAPMDIHILRLGEYSAVKYAIGHAKGDDYRTFLDSIQQWADNLRAQGYVRVVSLVISLQWSDPTWGPPWERLDESPPPRRAAGAEIDAAFLAERFARRRDLPQTLAQSCLRRAGPVALLDARVLGSDMPRRAKATLLRQASMIEHYLDPLEREILDRMEGAHPDARFDRPVSAIPRWMSTPSSPPPVHSCAVSWSVSTANSPTLPPAFEKLRRAAA